MGAKNSIEIFVPTFIIIVLYFESRGMNHISYEM